MTVERMIEGKADMKAKPEIAEAMIRRKKNRFSQRG